MNNGYQKSNGCGADKDGGKIFKTFFYPNAQSKHVRPLAYNGGDWRSKSLALLLMFSTTLDGFYFANCVLAAVFFLIDYQ